MSGEIDTEKLIGIAAKALDVAADEVKMVENYRWYGDLQVFTAKGCEIAIATEDQAAEAVIAYIKENLWTIEPELLARFTAAGSEDWTVSRKWLIAGIKALSEGCELSNDTLAAIITDVDGLIEALLSMYGRGRFLSPVDEEEHEIEYEDHIYYYYRLNR